MYIVDNFFGKLSVVEASQHEPSHYYSTKFFEPVNYEIEFQIYKEGETISEDQRKFGIEIETKYAELKIDIEKFINSEIEKIDGKVKRYDLENDLELRLITIPKSFNPIVEWSIEYAVRNDFSFFLIDFQNWKPCLFSISA